MPLGTLPILQIGFYWNEKHGMKTTNFRVFQSELQIQLSTSNIKLIWGLVVTTICGCKNLSFGCVVTKRQKERHANASRASMGHQ
jgi:hypothetical protein